MTAYPKVCDRRSLDAAMIEASNQGAGSITVPFFGGNSTVFDDLVRSGTAEGYRLWVEITLAPKGGV